MRWVEIPKEIKWAKDAQNDIRVDLAGVLGNIY